MIGIKPLSCAGLQILSNMSDGDAAELDLIGTLSYFRN